MLYEYRTATLVRARMNKQFHKNIYPIVDRYGSLSIAVPLSELCTPVAQVAEWQHICSASHHLHVVPPFQHDTYGRRTFAVAGPTEATRAPDFGLPKE